MTTIWTNIAARPYVFAFLVAFAVIGTLNRGRARTLLLLVIGTSVALVSEAISIRWGFPYGDYRFLHDAMDGEWIVWGVPLFSSLSFSFIAYASYETASVLKMRLPVLSTALLMTMADILIDPIALQGERWFLGQIYEYTPPGAYFGVPISNFAGWFVVGCVIVGLWRLACRGVRAEPPLREPRLGPAFYYGILGFIVVVGLGIGEYRSVTIGVALQIPVLLALAWRRRTAAVDRAAGVVAATQED